MGDEDWDYDLDDGDGSRHGDDAFRRRVGKVLHVAGAPWILPCLQQLAIQSRIVLKITVSMSDSNIRSCRA